MPQSNYGFPPESLRTTLGEDGYLYLVEVFRHIYGDEPDAEGTLGAVNVLPLEQLKTENTDAANVLAPTGDGRTVGWRPQLGILADYLLLAPNADLPNSRTFTPSARFAVADGGAGGAYGFDLNAALNDLTDVAGITVYTDGLVLRANGTGFTAARANVPDLGDVLLTGLADTQILKYDAATTKWKNVNDTLVTLNADADAFLSLTGQEIGLDTQVANTVFAGPAVGVDNEPTFRALVAADIPALPYQPSDAGLTSFAALPTAADKIAYSTAADVWAETALTAFARTILDDVDSAAVRATIGAGTGGGDLLANGTVPLTADWDVGAWKITANQLASDVATGTAPLIVASTTVVANLNADLLDGNAAAAFATAAHTHAGVYQPADADLDTWATVTPTANIKTFLATPTGANLVAALTTTAANLKLYEPWIYNPTATFKYVLKSSAIVADRDITLPLTAGTLALTSDLHNAVTLDANADTILSLSTQALGLDTQTANYLFAGPTTGAAAVPTFRAMVAADVPNLSGTYSVTGHNHTGVYQPADAQLTSVAGLVYAGNALKVVRVDAGATGFELAAVGTGDALVANPLSQFAATTSAQLAGVISDEVGTGLLMFNLGPTLKTHVSSSAAIYPGGVLLSNTTAVGNVGAGPDVLITYTMPALVLTSQGQSLEIITHVSNASGAAKRFKLYFGATAVWDEGATRTSTNDFTLRCLIVAVTSTAQKATCTMISNGSYVTNQVYTTPAETATGTIVIKGEATTCTNTNDIIQDFMYIRWFAAP